MRIVHISTVDCEGGAARAAFRLHLGLMNAGHASTMLVARRTSGAASVHETSLEGNFVRDVLQRQLLDLDRTELSNTHFSLGFRGVDLSEHPLVQGADILHLHWIAGFQSPATVARLQTLGKPVIWTLHDQRPMTGGCHFSAGCNRYEATCSQCPQLRSNPFDLPAIALAEQRELLFPENLTVVSPSRWLADCARSSALFGKCRIEVIPYGVDTQVFRAVDPCEARARLDLPDAAIHLLFGADYGDEKRKGFAQLADAVRACLQRPEFARNVREGNIRFLCFGRSAPAEFPAPVHPLGYIRNDEELARAYSAATAYLLPSLEDNLPCTMLESLACGTPVVAFAVGGVPDVLAEGACGYLAAPGDIAGLSKAITEVANHPERAAEMRRVCRDLAETRYSMAAQARAYERLYEKLHRQPVPEAKESRSHRLETQCNERLFDLVLGALEKHARERRQALRRKRVERWHEQWFLKKVQKRVRGAAARKEDVSGLIAEINTAADGFQETKARWKRRAAAMKKLLGRDSQARMFFFT